MTCGVCNGSKSAGLRTTQQPTTKKPELPKRTKCTRDEIGSLGCDQECLIVDEKPQADFQNDYFFLVLSLDDWSSIRIY